MLPGASQNVGNHITNTPTTRVLKPPGGGSSICFGGGGHEEPTSRASTCKNAQVRPAGGSSICLGEGGQRESSQRVSRKAKVPLPRSYSESGISIGWDNVPVSSGQCQPRRGSNATQSSAPQDVAVAGVRTNRLSEMSVQIENRLGKIKRKTSSHSTVGNDRQASDTMRYHQENGPAKGRQQKPAVLRPEATKATCESHRYFLVADGQADRLTGRASFNRTSSDASGGYPGEQLPAGKRRTCKSLCGSERPSQHSHSRCGASRQSDGGYSQSRASKSEASQFRKARSSCSKTTTATESRCSHSCYSDYSGTDSIPFGADWSTFCN